MLHPSTKKLIDRLAEMTELGKLDWTEGNDGSLVYSTEGYSVCLPDGAREIVIQSIEGKELERAAADALASTMSDQGTSYADIVAAMGAEANRYARGTETAISSLLAGMEDPAPAIEEDITTPAGEGPEDPVDESAALETEGIANHELQPETEPEPESEPEAETIAAADSEPVEETVPEPVEDAPALEEVSPHVEVAAEPEDAELETEAPVEEVTADTSEEAEPLDMLESETDEIDTESHVTEAVARLADQVNSRPEPAPVESAIATEETDPQSDDEASSTIGIAAATAMGVVASAAGLGQDDVEDTSDASDSQLDGTTDEAAEAYVAPTIETSSSSTYVPFGLEPQDEPSPSPDVSVEPETNQAETVAAAMVPALDPAPVETSAVAEDETTSADATEIADAPTEEPVSESASFEPEAEISVEPEEAVPVETADTPSEEDAKDVEVASTDAPSVLAASEAETEIQSAPEEPTPEPDLSESGPAEPEPEPVSVAPEAPKTYSLSGIGAGFGLGALSAKTEASGIPGPTSMPQAEPEKIVIDATDDVLPEVEANIDLEKMEAAVSEINFGNKDGGDSASESAADEDSDGDILKPRTRFNPWD